MDAPIKIIRESRYEWSIKVSNNDAIAAAQLNDLFRAISWQNYEYDVDKFPPAKAASGLGE